MSFNNHQNVQTQIGHQTISGNQNHYHLHHSDDLAVRKRQRLHVKDADPRGDLDDMILESLAFPQMTQRRRNIESPYLRTCEWIFETDEYRQWVAERTGLLWIRGKPGAGKSTLMSHLYRDLKSKLKPSSGGASEICLEYFFTARGVILEHSPLGLFRSLLNQIFYLDSSTRTPLRNAFREHLGSFNNTDWQWQQAELQTLLTDTVIASAQQYRIVIFIDALDEAGPKAAEETARFFYTLNDKASECLAGLGICIACRYYPIPPIRRQALEIHVEKHNYHAIESYVQGYIEEYIDDSMGDISRDKLSRELCEMANGVFQWVCLVMPLIRNRIEDGGSLNEIQKWLSQLSTDLDQLYEYIFKHIIEDKAAALRLFRWVCLASQPLSITELRYAIATHDLVDDHMSFEWVKCRNFMQSDASMQRCVRAWSGGLIEVTDSGSPGTLQAQPIHLTVSSYVRKDGLDLLTRSIIAFDEQLLQLDRSAALRTTDHIAFGHGQLYWCCLHYIAFEKERYTSLLAGSNVTRETTFLLLEKAVPLLQYAANNVLYHAKIAQGHRVQEVELEIQLIQDMISAVPVLVDVFQHESELVPDPGSTPLHIASAADLVDLIQHLVSQGFEISTADGAGRTALHIAALHGSLGAAQMLFSAGADLNMATHTGATSLVIAASRGQETMFAWLLQQGASIAASKTALYAAAFSGNTTIVRLCIKAGADIDAQEGIYGSALQAASLKGSLEIVRLLLDAGANVNAEGGEYGNALQTATVAMASPGPTETVRVLLEAGADVNAQGGYFGNALVAASEGGSTETVKVLLEAGANVNAEGGGSGNALHAAALWGSTETVKALLEAGANFNAEGGKYNNALQAAAVATSSSTEKVRLLLEAGADVNAQGGYFGNALQAAAVSYDPTEIVRALLEAGADINVQGGYFGNALQAAAASPGSLKTVRVLLEAGADVNAQGGHFGNALRAAAAAEETGWVAARKVSADIVKALLVAGAVTGTDAQGAEYEYASASAPSPQKDTE